MKKLLIVLGLLVILGTTLSSCKSRKHLCPAYSDADVKVEKVDNNA